jgi:ankyrin repeat protein
MRAAALLLVFAGLFPLGCQKPGVTIKAGPKGTAIQTQKMSSIAATAPLKTVDGSGTARYVERTKQLLDAADKGRLSLVLELIKKGADVNDKDDDGQTALHRAAAKGHKSLAVALLALGADMTEKDARGRTPVMLAAEAGNAEILGLLLTPDAVAGLAKDAVGLAGADLKVNLQNISTRLSTAVANVQDQTDGEGRTPLMLAAVRGHRDCVARLVQTFNAPENRNRVLRGDKKGQNALMLAAATGDAETLNLLLSFYGANTLTLDDLRKTDAQGKTALDLAEAGGHKLAVKRLWTELALKAAAEGNLDTVKAALEKYPNDIAPRAVMLAAARGGGVAVLKHLMERWKDRSAEEKQRLLTQATPGNVTTALYEAVQNDQPAAIKVLLDPEWWKEKEALIAFVRTKLGNSNYTVLDVSNHPELVKLVQERLKQLEGTK